MSLRRTTPLKRTRTRRRAPSELTRCDFWTPRRDRPPSRCTKAGPVVVDENTRYCLAHATETADRLVGDLVKDRDGGECILRTFNDQPCMGTLSACHLIPKGRYGPTRWVTTNIVAGCASHHVAFDQSPLEKEEWITRYLGAEHYDALKFVARSGAKYRPADVIRLFTENEETGS